MHDFAFLSRLLRAGLLALLFAVWGWPLHAGADEDFLEPEKAFKFSARMADPKTAEVSYDIADGYYMYKERFAFKAEGATLGPPDFPPAKVKYDDTFKKDVETYRKRVTIRIPVEAAGRFTLTATSQGCADKGLCYSPIDTSATLSPNGGGLLAAITGAGAAIDSAPVSNAGTQAAASQPDSDMGRIESSLKSGRLVLIVPLFLLLGIGLSFTPCVLPMVPILSFIIVGEGSHVSRRRALLLSAMYSLGMALIYTLLGVAAGLLGEGLSAALQNPWMLGAFALLMVMLSLSMFGVYQLQMPAAIQNRLSQLSERQARGRMLGVFTMGALSALIVGPCVAAPLAGALVYISQTRDVFIGGSALFSLAAGMSVPLLLVGLSAGALLPRAGRWMESVKHLFGILMLGMALWILSPMLPPQLPMFGWAALGIGFGAYLLWGRAAAWPVKAIGLLLAAFGLVQLVGVATGGRDALAPLAHLTGTASHAVTFQRIKSGADLDRAIAQAGGKPVMLDFYADWCVSCKEMEKLTFSDPRVQQRFAGMVLLQADVTANDADDKALLKRFRLFGPPGIIFFDRQGQEAQGRRVIGYQDADKFLRSVDAAIGG